MKNKQLTAHPGIILYWKTIQCKSFSVVTYRTWTLTSVGDDEHIRLSLKIKSFLQGQIVRGSLWCTCCFCQWAPASFSWAPPSPLLHSWWRRGVTSPSPGSPGSAFPPPEGQAVQQFYNKLKNYRSCWVNIWVLVVKMATRGTLNSFSSLKTECIYILGLEIIRGTRNPSAEKCFLSILPLVMTLHLVKAVFIYSGDFGAVETCWKHHWDYQAVVVKLLALPLHIQQIQRNMSIHSASCFWQTNALVKSLF